MARRLLADGDSVERLLLVDSALPDAVGPAVAAAGPGGRVHAGMEYGLDVDLDQLARMTPEEQLPFLWEHARQLELLDDGVPEDLARRVIADLRALFAHHVKLCGGFRPEECPVDAVLFRARDIPFDTGGPEDRGWGRFLRSVEVRRVPGHHHSMVMQPHAAGLAAAIAETLAAPTAEPVAG